MNWSEERYAKLYIRDTATWLMWPWQARAVLPLLLRKCDQATGELDLGKHALTALAVMLGMPVEVVEPAIEAMLATETLEQTPTGYLLTNFNEAQEATKTPALRKRDQRDRLRAQVRETTKSPVTRSHAASRGVTRGHEVSPSSPAQPPAQLSSTTSPAQPPAQLSSTTSPAQPPAQAELLHIEPVIDGTEIKHQQSSNVVRLAKAEEPKKLTPQQELVEDLLDDWKIQRTHRLTTLLGEATPDENANIGQLLSVREKWLAVDVEATCMFAAYLDADRYADLRAYNPATKAYDGPPQPWPLRLLLSEKVWSQLVERAKSQEISDRVHALYMSDETGAA